MFCKDDRLMTRLFKMSFDELNSILITTFQRSNIHLITCFRKLLLFFTCQNKTVHHNFLMAEEYLRFKKLLFFCRKKYREM